MILVIALFLGFVVWRVTHFLLLDSLIDEPRCWVQTKLVAKTGKVLYRKLLELTECPWCASVWIAAIFVAFYRVFIGDGLGWAETVLLWLATAGTAMAAWQSWEKD